MPQGIQVFFPDGTLSFDMTTRLTKVLGRLSVSGNYLSPSVGSLAVADFSKGAGFCYIQQPIADMRLLGATSITVTSSGFSYNVAAVGGSSATYTFNIVYGIY